LLNSVERIKRIAEASEGFLYAVNVTGITGARADFATNIQEHLTQLKEVCSVPELGCKGDHGVRKFN
jgi:tryptophan synthase alpha chain